MPFEFIKLEIPEVILIKPKKYNDERGFFWESYKQSEFKQNGIKEIFVQDNHSKSRKHVLRGLHYQTSPYEQGKLVQCIKGEIFDVAVDLRKKSKTFTKWVGLNLRAVNNYMLYIPPGFAHGFCSLQDNTEVTYKVTCEYSKTHDKGIFWNDPTIGINWPIKNVQVSEKDRYLPLIHQAELFKI